MATLGIDPCEVNWSKSLINELLNFNRYDWKNTEAGNLGAIVTRTRGIELFKAVVSFTQRTVTVVSDSGREQTYAFVDIGEIFRIQLQGRETGAREFITQG